MKAVTGLKEREGKRMEWKGWEIQLWMGARDEGERYGVERTGFKLWMGARDGGKG